MFRTILASLLTVAASAAAVSSASAAERVASVTAKYTFVLTENDNITIREAKIKAIDLAKAEAIRKEFGTLVASDLLNTEMGVNDNVQSFYVLDTSTSVKGEWLGDEKEPQVSIECADGEIRFTAEVWGKAREIVRAKTDLQLHVKKSKGDFKIDADRFISGERIYVTFRSPTDGYAAIYLITGDNETSCLLPYRNDTRGRVEVRGGKEYTFFDKSTDPTATHYKLSTKQLQEYNQLVVIYSPNPFTKCMDSNNTDPRRPNTLDQKEFAKWLLNNQRADREMVVYRRWITIVAPQQ